MKSSLETQLQGVLNSNTNKKSIIIVYREYTGAH